MKSLQPSPLNKANFDALKAAMDLGMTPVMSLYNPTHDGFLPAEPQIGAILLAQMVMADGDDVSLLPAASYFHSDDPRIGQAGAMNFLRTKRAHADVTVSFGTPVTLERIDIKPLLEFLKRKKMSAGEMNTPSGMKDTEREKAFQGAKEVRGKLKEQARLIADQIKSMIPQSKHAASRKSTV